MSKIVDVSDKSEEGIKKALTQIYAKFGIPAGYTDDIDKQLHILVKDPNIQHVNQAFLSLLVVMNKLQKDKPEQLSLAIQQIKTGNIDESLIKELGTFVLNNMPNEPISSEFSDINGFIGFIKDSGAVAPDVIEKVNKGMTIFYSIVVPSSTETSSTETSSTETSSTETSSTKKAFVPSDTNYAKPTISSSQKGGLDPLTAIAIVLVIISLVAVALGHKDEIKNKISNVFSCFGSKTTAGGKKIEEIANPRDLANREEIANPKEGNKYLYEMYFHIENIFLEKGNCFIYFSSFLFV